MSYVRVQRVEMFKIVVLDKCKSTRPTLAASNSPPPPAHATYNIENLPLSHMPLVTW